LYVVMRTSTVASGAGGGGSPRTLIRHIVAPKRNESIRAYVSARISGTAIHQACQLTENSHRHTT
jgi:hypothetical protein